MFFVEDVGAYWGPHIILSLFEIWSDRWETTSVRERERERGRERGRHILLMACSMREKCKNRLASESSMSIQGVGSFSKVSSIPGPKLLSSSWASATSIHRIL